MNFREGGRLVAQVPNILWLTDLGYPNTFPAAVGLSREFLISTQPSIGSFEQVPPRQKRRLIKGTRDRARGNPSENLELPRSGKLERTRQGTRP